MAVTKKALSFVSGDNVTYNLTFTQSNVAIDITDWIIYFTVKSGNTLIITKTITSHTDATSGLTQIDLLPADTEVTMGIYSYDIRVKTDSNEVFTVMNGTLTVEKQITEL